MDREHPDAPRYMNLRGTDKLPEGTYPFGDDWLRYHNIVSKFVSAYVDLYYPDDESVGADKELQDFFDGIQLPESQENQFPHRSLGSSKQMIKLMLKNMFVA